MSSELTKSIGELNNSAKKYFQTKVDLVKISLLEKTTRITSFMITFWVLLTFLIWIVVFIAAAFAVWYGTAYQNYTEGLLIASGGLFAVSLLFILFRKKIITPSLLKNFSEIIFEDED